MHGTIQTPNVHFNCFLRNHDSDTTTLKKKIWKVRLWRLRGRGGGIVRCDAFAGIHDIKDTYAIFPNFIAFT